MKRHFLIISMAALALLSSLFIGHWIGQKRGEERVAGELAAVARQSGLPQGSKAPPLPGGLGPRTADAAPPGPRSREELEEFVKSLKSKLFESKASAGQVSMSLNEREMSKALESLSLEEVRLAIGIISEMPPGLHRMAFSMALMKRWGQEDPASALEYFRTHRDEAGTFAPMWLNAIFMPWADRDAAAAANALAATLRDEQDDIVQGAIGNTVWLTAEKLTQANPAAAFQHVDALPEWASDFARSAVAKQVHDTRRQAFLESIRSLPAGAEKSAWQNAAATALAPVDAAAAAQWIDSLGLSDVDRHASSRDVFEKWKQHDPRAATEWAMTRLPDGDHSALLAATAESWAAREPNDCARWLGELEPGPQLDPAIAAFARAIAAKDPDSARAWADRITDTALRNESLAGLNK
ncbi:MAG: hypothetical protein ACKV19_18435 [Verrucomicrobiales bacterium]